jgi:thiosulfate/3-mercaptopyruvate sulfurtransferase
MRERPIRYAILALLIVAAAGWSLSCARAEERAAAGRYPNAGILATAEWLMEHRDEVVILDVRTDEYYDGNVIPGAVRLPWSSFRHDEKTSKTASTFVGIGPAERILGEHGVGREAEVVLYDSVARDGGATASYVFWVLDVLGHPRKRVLAGGIDAWREAGGELAQTPARREPVRYAAPLAEVQHRRLIDGRFLHQRLGDPHYQILDVRSPEEYLGKKGTKGVGGTPLKLGHIPTAYNLEYTRAWRDEQRKLLKPAAELQALYAGLAPQRTVVVYCNSGRRSSFSYFVLRLLGYPRVITYEPSWKEWGRPEAYFPVETEANDLPSAGGGAAAAAMPRQPATPTADRTPQPSARPAAEAPSGGYVSCGG